MIYDVRLRLEYDYSAPVAGARHLVRVVPRALEAAQRVTASALSFSPVPEERGEDQDYFGNPVTTVAYRDPQESFKVTMSARVAVERETAMLDVTPGIEGLQRELAGVMSLGPGSPHHFMAVSPRIADDPAIAAYAAESLARARSVREIVADVGKRLNRDIAFDAESTEVETSPADAFAQRRGVCQDFTHIMISSLRSLGVPAGYVSGFLRTKPPPGEKRLEGADAMHAWVRAWCGVEAGWLEYDPTNDMFVNDDHITVAYGRDYQDAAPIVGMLRTAGEHATGQFVDVIPVEQAGGTA